MTKRDDQETNEVLTEGEELLNMTRSRGWGIARGKLTEKILDLQNIHNVDDTSIDNVVVDMKSRKLAVAILFAFLKDIEGTASQHEANRELVYKNPESEEYIQRT